MRYGTSPRWERLALLTANAVLGRISAFEKSELAKPSMRARRDTDGGDPEPPGPGRACRSREWRQAKARDNCIARCSRAALATIFATYYVNNCFLFS